MPELQDLVLNDVLEFCLKYRKGNVFKDWTREQLATEIKHAYENQTMLVYVDGGVIKAFINWITGVDRAGDKYIYIKNALSIVPGVLNIFYSYAKQHRLTETAKYFVGRRRDKFIRYDFHVKPIVDSSTHFSV